MPSIRANDEQMAPAHSRYPVSAFGLLGSRRRSVHLVLLPEVITAAIQATEPLVTRAPEFLRIYRAVTVSR